jgi:hypothetical protein
MINYVTTWEKLSKESDSQVDPGDQAKSKAARTLRAFRTLEQFWNTGNEALVDQAFTEIFAEDVVSPPRPRRMDRD